MQYNLQQLVDFDTHKSGHIIDFVITRRSDALIQSVSASEFVSDHCAVTCIMNLRKPEYTKSLLHYRKVNSIDLNKFADDVITSPLSTAPASTVSALANQYDSVLSQLINSHAPVKTRYIVDRPAVPWYNELITLEKH